MNRSLLHLTSPWLEADICTHGGECVALRDAHGRDYLWNGEPSAWSGISPLLFPIVGLLPADTARIDGKEYTIGLHGFARTSNFNLIDATDTCCILRLEATDATRRAYPFEFSLTIGYTLADRTLSMDATVENRSGADMPVAFGFHPGFRWPLPGGTRDGHAVTFAEAETAPVHHPLDGLLNPVPFETPVRGRRLDLYDDLFLKGAIVFDDVRSRSLRFGADNGPGIHVGWENCPHLGIWTKPGAGFLCIEPWQGYAAPAGFDGELADKPGMLILPPGASRSFSMRITLEDAA